MWIHEGSKLHRHNTYKLIRSMITLFRALWNHKAGSCLLRCPIIPGTTTKNHFPTHLDAAKTMVTTRSPHTAPNHAKTHFQQQKHQFSKFENIPPGVPCIYWDFFQKLSTPKNPKNRSDNFHSPPKTYIFKHTSTKTHQKLQNFETFSKIQFSRKKQTCNLQKRIQQSNFQCFFECSFFFI